MICHEEGCSTTACFNNYKEKKAAYCRVHKKANMVDIVHTKCKELGCSMRPSYNHEGQKAKFCFDHKEEDMVNVVSKRCSENGCNKFPNFNYINEKKAEYCYSHKKELMVDVKNKRCLQDNCNKRPNFNYEGKKAEFCEIHKKELMIDVLHKKCLENGCNTRPTFNYEGKKNGVYCTIHKKDKMINVVDKKCLHESCNIQPTFNYEGKKNGVYCAIHKKKLMICVTTKKCHNEGCNTQPHFNYEGKKNGVYCTIHKKHKMICVTSNKCIECNDVTANEKYKNHCLRCFINKFPDQEITTNYKIKERHMTDFIKEHFENEEMIFDKRVNNGCSKRIPDCYIDKFTHVLIIECDENQHKSQGYSCDNKRTMELFQDFGNRPLVFIRFNPDAYKINDKKIMSCFKIHKSNSVLIVNNKNELKNRLDKLRDKIGYWLNNIPTREITYEYMFYDQNFI